MHCSMPFYVRDLNIHGFGYLHGWVLELIPYGYHGMTQVWGSQKLYPDFWLSRVIASNPSVVQGSVVITYQ